MANYLKELEKFEENQQQKTSVSSVSEATAKSQKANPLIDKTFTSSVGSVSSVSTSVSKGGCQSEFDFSNITYLSINKENPPLVGNKTIKNNFKNATDKADKTDKNFTADKPADYPGVICGRCQHAAFVDEPNRFYLFCRREKQPVIEMRSCPLNVWRKNKEGYQV